MGNSESVAMKPEEVKSLMEEVRDSNQELLEEIEIIKVNHEQEMKKMEVLQKETERSWNEVNWELEEVRDSNQELLEEIEAIKVSHDKEIYDLKMQLKKKDELQKKTERLLNEVKWELEEMKEQNRESEINLLQRILNWRISA